MRLKAKLMLVFLLVFGIALISLSIMNYFSTKKQLQQNIEFQLQLITEKNAENFDTWLMGKAEVVRAVKKTIESKVGSGWERI